MSDITERDKLERAAHFLREEGFEQEAASVEEAADEIERLRAALQKIKRVTYWLGIEYGSPFIEWDDGSPEDIAEAALRGQG